MPESDDLALLIAAAQDAGRIAAEHFGREPAQWDKTEGQGPVSVADIEIDRALRAGLLRARPGFGWLSEETPDDPARLGVRDVFIVDPIDGTRAFLAGQKSFAHALAIARDGAVIAGVVHLPMLGLTYSARRGAGAWLNAQPLRVPATDRLGGARVLTGRAQLATGLWPGGVPPVVPHFRPSLAWRLCLVAEGRFDAALTLRDTWHWDTAAASLIASEAGARVSDRCGRALTFNVARPMSRGLIAAPPGLHAQLIARLQPRPPTCP